MGGQVSVPQGLSAKRFNSLLNYCKLNTSRLKKYARIDLGLAVIAIAILLIRIPSQPLWLDNISPREIYSLSLFVEFDPDQVETNIYTYLPLSNARQTHLQEQISDNLSWTVKTNMSGRQIHWSGEQQVNDLSYHVKVATKPIKYNIDESLALASNVEASLLPYIEATEKIQVGHPEIQTLWQSIKPADDLNVKSVLKAIFDYTYKNIDSASFKGTTDALTALRLGVASCNGKSRLFVALARHLGLPARLVGGVILDEKRKRTSHQWVEVYIENHWIPFGPTNGYFAEVPAHYLRLYQGDESLIRHTANINFNYEFDIKKLSVSPVTFQELLPEGQYTLNLSALLKTFNLSAVTISVLLLFPLCTLLITFLRNVVGIKTYGIFMPLLVAAVCLHSGLLIGLLGFGVILLFAWSVHAMLDKMRLLKTARLAIVITSVTLFILTAATYFETRYQLQMSVLALFPIVIISFVAEKIYQDTSHANLSDILKTSMGSVLTIALCYLALNSVLLQGLFSLYPETYLLVLSVLIYIGGWSGLRINELVRFRRILAGSNVMGINKRNRDVVYQYNDQINLSLAADKLKSKQALETIDVPCPKTLAVFNEVSCLSKLGDIINNENSFVVKPNKGSQGKGIVVIREKTAAGWRAANGDIWTLLQLENHLHEILCGTYSQDGENDTAYIEPCLIQHTELNNVSNLGLCDIRIIVAKGRAVSAMLRVPTAETSGKANLHQGAVGVAIDLENGYCLQALHKGKLIHHHPDSNFEFSQLQIPFWQKILHMSERCYTAVPLGYLGVDICLDQAVGPLVLEVNGRPGLEIQNVHRQGFESNLMSVLEARPS